MTTAAEATKAAEMRLLQPRHGRVRSHQPLNWKLKRSQGPAWPAFAKRSYPRACRSYSRDERAMALKARGCRAKAAAGARDYMERARRWDSGGPVAKDRYHTR